jgi:hypothetical protein
MLIIKAYFVAIITPGALIFSCLWLKNLCELIRALLAQKYVQDSLL